MDRLSFWLLPPKTIQDLYQPIIDSLSQKLKTPKFEPHISITIAVSLKGEDKSILQMVEKAVKNIRPIPVEFSEVSVSTTYFQCVFARVKPSLEIFQAYQLVKSSLRHADPSMYVPHMSLVYGNLDLSQRFEIAKSIKLPATKFLADRIGVVNADSLDPKTWKRVAEFELK
jgi:hypothetical protein